MAELPRTARRGVLAGQIGLLLAVVGTLLRHEVISYQWILLSFADRRRNRRPARVSDADDGCAAVDRAPRTRSARWRQALVGTAEYYRYIAAGQPITGFTMVALVIETVLGYLTFTASVMAFGKLQEIVPTRPHHVSRTERRQPDASRDRGSRWASG